MKAVLLSLRHFQEVIQRKSLLIATDQYDSGGLSSESRGNSLLFSVSSMQRNCVAMRQSPDSVDSETCPRQSESNSGCIISILCSSEYGMRVTSSNFSSYHSDMGSPPIDLFATSLNYKLETFVSPTPDQKAWAVHAMTISWKRMFNYIFPPFRLLHRILCKIREDGCKTILIAPAWPRQSWFLDLLLLSCAKPLRFPLKGDLLYQFKGESFIKAWRNSICTHGYCQDVYQTERLF